MNYTNLIVGASSGIGQEIVKLQSHPNEILIATYKNNPHKIPEADNLIKMKLDLADQENIICFVEKIKKTNSKIKRIFLFGAIPGVNSPDLSFSMKPSIEDMVNFSTVNCFGYIRFLSEIIGTSLIKEDCRICVLSSLAGSSTLRGKLIHNKPGGNLPYRISKAALNSAVKNIAYDLSLIFPKIIIFSVHPGWVKTSKEEQNAITDPKDAAYRIFELMGKIKLSQNGEFLDSYGIPLGF